MPEEVPLASAIHWTLWPTEILCPTCKGYGLAGGGSDYSGEYWEEWCSDCDREGIMLWMRPSTKQRDREATRMFEEFSPIGEF